MKKLVMTLVLPLVIAIPLVAQTARPGTPPSVAGPDSVTVVAGSHYAAGGMRQAFVGGTYRDLWATPVRVPVLNMHTFAGGLRPLKAGGGHQTKSLHLSGTDGTLFTFRPVDKDGVDVPEMWRGSIVQKAARDAGSNAHPAGAFVAARLLDAANVLHVTPVLVAMPDDALLGEFRHDYAHRLGIIEESPSVPKSDTPGFAGAIEILDSDSLLARINRDPLQHVDARAYLTARLVDMLINDWDRGPDQWRWATFQGDRGNWVPIPRDRDDALFALSGLGPKLVAGSSQEGLAWSDRYGPMSNLNIHSVHMDPRLLGGLERAVWDSLALALRSRLTDAVIEGALAAQPPEYRGRHPELLHDLKARRDSLPAIAQRRYLSLAEYPNLHATDAADRATVTRVDATHVTVRIQTLSGTTYFQRTFSADETRGLTIYLHNGDDAATVVGDVPSSIAVRIVGGNGNNAIVDSSRVSGHHVAELHDVGATAGVKYGVDTLFDRRPMLVVPGGVHDPIRDHGQKISPKVGLSINHDFGMTPRAGFERRTYGFDQFPYSSLQAIEGRYSLKRDRYKVSFNTDNRFENSPWHVTTLARVSQMELMSFYGYGNNTTGSVDTAHFDVRQQQLLFQPAIALALGPTTDLTFGPVIKASKIDDVPGRLISDTRPYGFGTTGSFSTASLRLGVHHDNREPRRHAHEGTTFDVGGSYFPAIMDVTAGFAEVDASGGLYVTLPVPTEPALALRGGVKKLFGDFPFIEAAFLGGTTSVRTLDPQRYAGDAAVYATAELRVPLVRLHVLAPIDVGVMGTVDYGRVYVDGASPGGWHYAAGAGFWFGLNDLTADIRIMRGEDGKPSVVSLRFATPIGTGH
jgi:Omp85 superfamily domain